ncbi:MAG: hypothetical protein QOI94_575 [Acidobacteriaceae bacterium]|nr:hypothetical protein [Acidobacteriaceae bacterium]
MREYIVAKVDPALPRAAQFNSECNLEIDRGHSPDLITGRYRRRIPRKQRCGWRVYLLRENIGRRRSASLVYSRYHPCTTSAK